MRRCSFGCFLVGVGHSWLCVLQDQRVDSLRCPLGLMWGALVRAPPGAPGLAPGMTSGWVMCPRCNGGGDTDDTLPRFGLVLLAGPPFVLGGFAGLTGWADTELRDRDRLREKLSLPLVEMGVGGGRTGLGVCLWTPFERWNSLEVFAVVEPEMFEKAASEDMCDVKELTLDGSPPFDEALVFRANG